MQRQTQVKGEMTGRATGRHLIKQYSNGVKKFLIIDDIKQFRRDINEDPIIKDSVAVIGALMVSKFGKWLSPILISCHMANHTKVVSDNILKSYERLCKLGMTASIWGEYLENEEDG